MNSAEAAALAAIDATYAEPVTYTGAGLTGETIMVIWSDFTAPAFPGAGNTLRQKSCEVQQSDVSARPAKADHIVRDGVSYRPIDITQRDDIGKWVLILERAPS